MMVRRPRKLLLATAVVGLTAALVGSAALDGAAAPPVAAAHGPIEVTTDGNPGAIAVALPTGSIDLAIQQIPALAADMQIKSKVPGLAVAVVHGGQTVFTGGYGVRELGKTDPIDPKTVFQLASLSKPIGATVVATQVSKEVVAWDTPVRRELPHFALADPWITSHVTIGDFYSHRSGLPPAAGDLLEDVGYNRSYILDHLRQDPLSPFRSTYAYANFGMTVGAEAVAKAAGTSWSKLSDKALYGPLGMKSTSSRYSDFVARPDRAILHTKIGDHFEPLFTRDADAQAPAGGVSSNVIDVATWMKMVLAKGMAGKEQLIKPAALQPAVRPEMINSANTDVTARAGSYGYGFNVGVQPGGRVGLGHSGAFVTGAGTAFSIIPSADTGIVVLTNGAPVGAAEALIAEFNDLVQFGHITRDWFTIIGNAFLPFVGPAGDLAGKTAPKNPVAAAKLSRYAGRYHNAYYGDLVLRVRGDHLVAALGAKGRYRVDVDHWNGDTFSFVPTGENAPYGSLSSAKFRIGRGKASRVTLAFFNAHQLGVWKR